VHQFLRLLERRGAACAPRFLGTDERGRETLSFHEGWVPPNLEGRRWSDAQIVAAATVVRELHDASAGSALADRDEVVCHGDLSPCNFVFVDGRPTFLIDFDRAHSGSRKRDLAYMAWMWLVGAEDDAESPPLEARLRQLTLLLETYGLVDRERFAEAIEAEQRAVDAAAAWVQSEIEFVRAHADAIAAAAQAVAAS
jgi:aminoglycoside phosphotransferase (APT) family kinase protein